MLRRRPFCSRPPVYSNREPNPYWTSQVTLAVKTPPANAGEVGSTPGLVRSPEGGNGNPLCILASEIQRTEEPGGLQSMGLQESDTT